MARIVALIRGINVGSTRKLPMAELRAACAEAGLGTVRTYIQSGNLVVEEGEPAAIEAKLEAIIKHRFGHDAPVVARTADAWDALIAVCPLVAEARDDPKRTVLLVTKRPILGDAVEALAERARHDERIARCGDGIVIHYPQGQADTKLSPALIDRLMGSSATGRNWATVLKIAEMARA